MKHQEISREAAEWAKMDQKTFSRLLRVMKDNPTSAEIQLLHGLGVPELQEIVEGFIPGVTCDFYAQRNGPRLHVPGPSIRILDKIYSTDKDIKGVELVSATWRYGGGGVATVIPLINEVRLSYEGREPEYLSNIRRAVDKLDHIRLTIHRRSFQGAIERDLENGTLIDPTA